MKYTITVFGLGFVGLTTALAFAEKGNNVIGIDVDSERTKIIRNGKIPFVEPGLDDALKEHLNHNFQLSSDPKEAAKESDFLFLCVGTPSGAHGEADLQYIFSALDMCMEVLEDGKFRTIVIKSTIPPSTTQERIIPYLVEKGFIPGEDFSVANNPEFLREGKSWEDMMNADRIVCGISDNRSEKMLKNLYAQFDAPFFSVSHNTAEFIKYLSNTMLATMISFANEMSRIADAIGDIQLKDAFNILHLDRRWHDNTMSSYVYPGVGYGGYCLPKDTKAMAEIAVAKGYQPDILNNVIEVNRDMPRYMTEKIKENANPHNKIGILGLSFKPGSDDVRDSSSAKIISLLIQSGYENILVFDPVANDSFARLYNFDNVVFCNSAENLCEESDVIALATAWEEFIGINKKYPDKQFLDLRYFL
jgi:UDPglucose 6-dehydrogenase